MLLDTFLTREAVATVQTHADEPRNVKETKASLMLSNRHNGTSNPDIDLIVHTAKGVLANVFTSALNYLEKNP